MFVFCYSFALFLIKYLFWMEMIFIFVIFPDFFTGDY